MDLNNDKPLDTLDPVNAKWLANLQGNILNGHGRDNTVHLFLRLPGDPKKAKSAVRQLKHYVTSALKQEKERIQFKKYDIPGGLFGNLFLSARGYAKLGYSPKELEKAFTEPEEKIRAVQSNFLEGMAKHAETDLGDPPPEQWEDGFRKGGIDAMLLLADDDDGYLLREARNFLDSLPEQTDVVHIERGTALRTREGEGIEHFGYVDGRSQPLFLASDFQDLEGGAIGPNTREKDGGKVDVWNPFEPLKLVLLPDPLAKDPDCLGSYFVFRKLEQNVRGFIIKEQDLADKLKLEGTDRERAGAMAVGRFRDGTPLVLSPTDGFAPPKENNFRYDSSDPEALKCPFHAHIRKTNPRGDIVKLGATEAAERSRRIARRGIPFGDRNPDPDNFNALGDVPSSGVGLLFMCFQSSIRTQFAFMQRGWANNKDFVRKPDTGLDPIIGQRDTENGELVDLKAQKWRPEYGSGDKPQVEDSFRDFVKMKGGEFFFTPSIPFLEKL
jgi:Dyp-type peroxidase family